MTSGQLLLVLAQEGETLVIHDPTCADNRAEVPVTEFLPYFSGTSGQTPSGLFSAVREFGSVREFFTATTLGTLTDLPFVVLFLSSVASIGGNVVWVLFAGAVLMVLPLSLLQVRMIQQTQGANTKSNKQFHDVIHEADTIKANRDEERFRQMWGELTTVAFHATSEQRKLASTLTFWAQGGSQATYVAAIVTGSFVIFGHLYRGHERRGGHPDLSHFGAADPISGDAGALVQRQGGA